MRIKAKYLIGIDEVGRGPLAGPITVAAVYCSAASAKDIFQGIKDSKKLSAKQREEWRRKFKILNFKFKIIYSTASVNNQIIDTIGINKATDLAIKKVISNLKRKIAATPSNCFIVLDGLLKAPKKYPQETIIKGDEKIPIISAASIIAKVTRDRKMIRFHKKFPNYHFNFHKGYGTKLHYEMLKKFGLSFIHRKSYCKIL